jgi:hypothetical protein
MEGSSVLRLPPALRPTIAEGGEALLTRLLVYGTPGWGKSYLMAAAATVLKQDFIAGRSCMRVVYVPDCGQLRREPVSLMRRALLIAFAEDANMCELIASCSTVDGLIQFCQAVPRSNSFLLFIADQTNKLTSKHTDSPEKQQQKGTADRLLQQASFHHFLVEAISINDSNKEDVAQKQENRKELPVFGEMSEVNSRVCVA